MSAPCPLCEDGVDYRYGDIEVPCGACDGTGRIDRSYEEDETALAIASEDRWALVAAVEGPR